MMILNYHSKKDLKENVGQELKYTETCTDFGFPAEFKTSGTFVGCNRPQDPRGTGSREFFAKVTMQDGLISKISWIDNKSKPILGWVFTCYYARAKKCQRENGQM